MVVWLLWAACGMCMGCTYVAYELHVAVVDVWWLWVACGLCIGCTWAAYGLHVHEREWEEV